MDVTVICGTFGHPLWAALAWKRAAPPVFDAGIPFIHVHGKTLAQARNAALAQVRTEFVVCCDADDELELPDFFEAMEKGRAHVRAPSTRIMRAGRPARLVMPQVWGHTHQCTRECLPYGNWCVVGSVAFTSLLRRVGGWQEYGWSEDWALWLRCYKLGALFESIPEAVYRQHQSDTGRNRHGQGFENREYWHRRIVTDILGELPVA